MNASGTVPGFRTDPYAQAYPEAEPFWAAAETGRLLVKRCRSCGKAHWYPRVLCPLCGSAETDWETASGEGRIYAFSVIERADPPYVLAYVELDEGPCMLSNVIGCDPARLAIGMPVRAVFQRTPDGRSAPFFTPREAQG